MQALGPDNKPISLRADASGNLLVGATLTVGDITIDLAPTNAILTDILSRSPDKSTDWQYAAAGITNSAAAVVMAAAVVAKRHYVEAVQLTGDAGTGQHVIEILSAATVIWRGAMNMATDTPTIITFPKALKGGVNESISVKMATVDPGTLYASAQGYTL